MPRKTKYNNITSPEKIAQINPDNKRLMEDFLMYLQSTQKSETTRISYKNDLEIFFVWNMEHNRNKFFVDIAKRDIVALQNWLINENGNSPSRVRRLKATLSSLSNYIENILDDEYPNFKNIINKIESPSKNAVREKTIFSQEQLDRLLKMLVDKEKYQEACCLALCMCSGSRKSELPRFKVSYFTDDNLVFDGVMYKTPEKIKSKGRSLGKYIFRYTLAKEFKPYFDLWMKQRKELAIDSEWLFVTKNIDEQTRQPVWEQINITTLNSWASKFSRWIEDDFYWHSLRHFFTTKLSESGMPDSVIQTLISWESADMCRIYIDTPADTQIANYFTNVKEDKAVE